MVIVIFLYVPKLLYAWLLGTNYKLQRAVNWMWMHFFRTWNALFAVWRQPFILFGHSIFSGVAKHTQHKFRWWWDRTVVLACIAGRSTQIVLLIFISNSVTSSLYGVTTVIDLKPPQTNNETMFSVCAFLAKSLIWLVLAVHWQPFRIPIVSHLSTK